jgi:hypothetical protein
MRVARERLSPWLALGGIALAIVVGMVTPVAAAQGLLDGKTFVGQTGEKGKTTGDAEEVTFTAGTFHSKECDPYGFKAAPYKATRKDGVISFAADTTSAKEGKMHWAGTVEGDVLEGTAVWTKPGQAEAHYWVKGTLKK